MKQLDLTDAEFEWLKIVIEDAKDFAEDGLGSFDSGLPQIEVTPGDWEINTELLSDLQRKINETT
jgi:hypothetical protein